jgi:hypothetical protein
MLMKGDRSLTHVTVHTERQGVQIPSMMLWWHLRFSLWHQKYSYVIASASGLKMAGKTISFSILFICLSHHHSSTPSFFSVLHIKTFPSPTTLQVLHSFCTFISSPSFSCSLFPFLYCHIYVSLPSNGLHATICTHYSHSSLHIIAVAENNLCFSVSSNGKR